MFWLKYLKKGWETCLGKKNLEQRMLQFPTLLNVLFVLQWHHQAIYWLWLTHPWLGCLAYSTFGIIVSRMSWIQVWRYQYMAVLALWSIGCLPVLAHYITEYNICVPLIAEKELVVCSREKSSKSGWHKLSGGLRTQFSQHFGLVCRIYTFFYDTECIARVGQKEMRLADCK